MHRDIYETFRDALLAHVRENLKSGDPHDRAVTVGPLIDLAARDRVLAWTDEAPTTVLTKPDRPSGPRLLAAILCTNTGRQPGDWPFLPAFARGFAAALKGK